MTRLWCWLFGHRAFRSHSMPGASPLHIEDARGAVLITIECCDRCHDVFWRVPDSESQTT